MKRRLAYFTPIYPAISQTFIQREIDALRNLDYEVVSYSINLPHPSHIEDKTNKAEFLKTTYILNNIAGIIMRGFLSLVLHPIRFTKLLILGWRMSSKTLHSIILHFAYVLESIKLARLLIRARLTHIHVHFATNAAAVAKLSCSFEPSLSYSVSVHGPTEFDPINAVLLRSRVDSARFIRCISNYSKKKVMSLSDFPGKKIHVIHCGILVSEIEKVKASRNESSSLDIVSVGRLVPAKNFLVLIKAFDKLQLKIPNVKLVIYGDGPDRFELENLIIELGLSEKVFLPGLLSNQDILEKIASANIFASSSSREGIPVVLMEAMSLGTPVVATEISGIPELIEHKKTGLLAEANNIESLFGQLSLLCLEPSLRKSLAENAKPFINMHFNVEAEAQKLDKLFDMYL